MEMSNFDYIRQSDKETMATILGRYFDCNECPMQYVCRNFNNCHSALAEWLDNSAYSQFNAEDASCGRIEIDVEIPY